jgi:hypothetical protein
MSSVYLALPLLVLLGSALPSIAQAQQPSQDLVSFKATVSGKFEGRVIPIDPPIACSWMNLTGTSDLLGGAVTYIDTHTAHLGVDGNLIKSTDGVGVFTGPAGDALFINWDAVGRTDGVIGGQGAFIIRGGRGKFAGAVGSGTFKSEGNFAKQEVTQVYEGWIVLPKK